MRHVALAVKAGRVPLDPPVGLGRDHSRLASPGQAFEHARIGVERLVGDQCASLHTGEQVVGPCEVVGLACGQVEADRVAERVHHRVYLRAQAAAGASDRLVLAGAVRANFFWAPALCWWARTTVLSIIACSLSASAAK